MLQPTQPARRASGDNGLRASITLSVKKKRGTTLTLLTSQSSVYCSRMRFGTASLRIASIIAAYAASTIFVVFLERALLSWNLAEQAGQTRSTARVFGGHSPSTSDGQAGQ